MTLEEQIGHAVKRIQEMRDGEAAGPFADAGRVAAFNLSLDAVYAFTLGRFGESFDTTPEGK